MLFGNTQTLGLPWNNGEAVFAEDQSCSAIGDWFGCAEPEASRVCCRQDVLVQQTKEVQAAWGAEWPQRRCTIICSTYH
jgi:hypothetical protein